MDASSLYQDDLPTSSDALLKMLDGWGLRYRMHRHVPLRTVEDAKAVEADLAVPGERALRTKNLFLRDKKKRNYLVTLDQDREIDLKSLAADLGAGTLSFGSPERLLQVLGVRPGAVSPLALINGGEAGVRFFLDPAAQAAEVIYMHPLVNDRTLAMTRADAMAFFERIGVAVNWVPGL